MWDQPHDDEEDEGSFDFETIKRKKINILMKRSLFKNER